jgi:predicted GIY-YIG superfamily endonuclease
VANSDKRFVYILESLSVPDRHYIGLTDDVDRRLAAHNNGQSRHTAKHRPWRVHVVMQFSNEHVAARFEGFLKSGSGRAFAKRHFQ